MCYWVFVHETVTDLLSAFRFIAVYVKYILYYRSATPVSSLTCMICRVYQTSASRTLSCDRVNLAVLPLTVTSHPSSYFACAVQKWMELLHVSCLFCFFIDYFCQLISKCRLVNMFSFFIFYLILSSSCIVMFVSQISPSWLLSSHFHAFWNNPRWTPDKEPSTHKWADRWWWCGVYSHELLPIINMSKGRKEKRNIALYQERWGIFVEVFRCRCNHAWASPVCKVPLHLSTYSRFTECLHISFQVAPVFSFHLSCVEFRYCISDMFVGCNESQPLV